jgi:serine/threonine-protein kinase
VNLTGTVLGGRYEIAEKLGAGGMAVVFRAQDSLLQRPVTVKVLRGEFVADENVVKRFRREAQAAASLSHPNIVGVYDVGRQDDIHYIVMEYVQGKTLKDLISERGPVPAEEAARIGRQICEALRKAHSHRIIHRDVKPQNVLITNEGRVKVTDFGIAGAATGSTVTYPGALLGTVYYFSPEQAQGRYGDERSDLYALGVVLYEMLTGQVPFEGESPVAVALKHIREAAVPPRELNPRVPPSAERVVMKAMVKEVERRYQTAADMLRDLEALQRQLAEWRTRGGRAPVVETGARDQTQVVASEATSGRDESTLPGTRPGTGPRGGTGTGRGGGRDGDGPPGDGEGAGFGGIDPDFELDRPVARPKARRRLSRSTLWIVSFGIFFALVGLGLFWVVQWFEVPTVSVPNVIGKTLLEAQSTLAQHQLDARVVSHEYNAEVPAGQVIDQDPGVGAMVKVNRTVSLWVSLGPQFIDEVPNVVGQTWREAKIALEQAGLTVNESDFTWVHSEALSKDRVISQEPRGGAGPVARGTKAFLVVSLGPQGGTVVVPNFVGQTLEGVRAILGGLNLTEGAITLVQSDKSDGTILGQDPDPGTPVARGTPVNLTVAGSGGSDPGGSGGSALQTIVSFRVPATPAVQSVRIVVTDSQGQRTVYEHEHAAGHEGRILVNWTGSLLRVQVFYNGSLTEEYTVTSGG